MKTFRHHPLCRGTISIVLELLYVSRSSSTVSTLAVRRAERDSTDEIALKVARKTAEADIGHLLKASQR